MSTTTPPTNAGLVVAATSAIKESAREIALSKLFLHAFTSKPLSSGETVKIRVHSGDPAGSYNESTNNYGTVDNTLGYAYVKIDQHKKHTFGISESDLGDNTAGSIWDTEGEIGGRSIGLALETDIFGKLTYSAAKAQIEADPVHTTLADLIAVCGEHNLNPRDCTVVLTAEAYGKILKGLDYKTIGDKQGIEDGIIRRLYGFKAVTYSTQLPKADSASTNNAWGCIVPTSAIAVASAPVNAEISKYGVIHDFGSIQDPNSGVIYSAFRFLDPNTLTLKANVLTHYGCKLTYHSTECPKAPRYLQLKQTSAQSNS